MQFTLENPHNSIKLMRAVTDAVIKNNSRIKKIAAFATASALALSLKKLLSFKNPENLIEAPSPRLLIKGASDVRDLTKNNHNKSIEDGENGSDTSAYQSRIEDIKKLNPVVQHLNDLPPLSSQFDERMAMIRKGSGVNEEAFMAGVELFTEIANLTPSERESLFGSKYRGLHYENDLATLWNKTHAGSPILASRLTSIVPLKGEHWDSQVVDDNRLLVYRGSQPSRALDTLLAGPAVIDCGMFCQLGLWFGIRAMVGDKKFDQLFGRAPFFLTQYSYHNILRCDGVQEGNPLFPFLSFEREAEKDSSQVEVRYFPNVDEYKMKHLGGADNGHNALSIKGKFTIFDPTSRKDEKFRLTEEKVFEVLRTSFNATRSQNVLDKISSYKMNPQVISPRFNITLGALCFLSEALSNKTMQKEEFLQEVSLKSSPNVLFDLKKFASWLAKVEAQDKISSQSIAYQPLAHSQLHISAELQKEIPHENREQMSFEAFDRKSPVQEQLYNLAQYFCHKAGNQEEIWLTLWGKAGVGKTAIAVACAKELASRGKRVCWISESTVSRWAEACSSMAEISQLNKRIREKLDGNDIIILDDNNLAGRSGKALLEEVYRWYCEKSHRAVLVTSNVALNFNDCFGIKLEGYQVPPFLSYGSDAFINQHVFYFSGASQRPAQSHVIHALPSGEKLAALQKKNLAKEHRSIGAIISKEAYQRALGVLIHEREIEVIPAFPPSWQDDILSERYERGCFYATDTEGYKALTPLQKQWTRTYPIYKYTKTNWNIMQSTSEVECIGVAMNPFASTSKKSIAIELLERKKSLSNKTIISEDGFNQLCESSTIALIVEARKLLSSIQRASQKISSWKKSSNSCLRAKKSACLLGLKTCCSAGSPENKL